MVLSLFSGFILVAVVMAVALTLGGEDRLWPRVRGAGTILLALVIRGWVVTLDGRTQEQRYLTLPMVEGS
jgi:hypothetical protein